MRPNLDEDPRFQDIQHHWLELSSYDLEKLMQLKREAQLHFPNSEPELKSGVSSRPLTRPILSRESR